jgi:hypothetical protein
VAVTWLVGEHAGSEPAAQIRSVSRWIGRQSGKRCWSKNARVREIRSIVARRYYRRKDATACWRLRSRCVGFSKAIHVPSGSPEVFRIRPRAKPLQSGRREGCEAQHEAYRLGDHGGLLMRD